jgi:hypothetical protein
MVLAVTSVASSSLPTLTLAVTPKTITVGRQMMSGAARIATTVSGEKQDNPTFTAQLEFFGLQRRRRGL